MAEADAVLIPSRRTYPEGFPKTINEGLCSRTPLFCHRGSWLAPVAFRTDSVPGLA